jgi:surfeit locus 1 family protein
LSKAFQYKIGPYQISINVWLLIAFLLMQTLLNELGFWQLERAKEKQYRVIQLEKGNQSVLTSLNSISSESIEQFQSVELELELNDKSILFLDNKIMDKRPGYHVLNVAFEKASGKNIIINRGWVFAGADRRRLPTVDWPQINWQVSARIYPIAAESISTAMAQVEKHGKNYRLPVLDLAVKAKIESALDLKLEDYVLRLNRNSNSALETNWLWTNMTPEKHLGYAFQWFALSLALLVLSVIASTKKIKRQ